MGVGEAKARRTFTPGALLPASVFAGAYIALGGTLSVIIGQGFPGITAHNPAMARILSGLVFPLGLMLVVLLGADLFTGNNALLVPPAMRGRIGWGTVIMNWAAVWIANFAGALLFGYFFVHFTGLFDAEPYSTAIVNMAVAKTSCSWWVVFVKGIGANWCVCLAVWLALASRTLAGKMLACELPVFAFVALGFEHCVANMFFIPVGMMQGAQVSLVELFTANLIPATLGNIVGGALFVGMLFTWQHGK